MSTARDRRARRGACAVLLAALLALASLALAAPALAAPRWGIAIAHGNPYGPGNPYFGKSPVNFNRESVGDFYALEVKNEGEVYKGPLTVRDQLPKGLVFTAHPQSTRISGTPGGGAFVCNTVEHAAPGPSEAVCKLTIAPEGKKYNPIQLNVHVSEEAPASVTNKATLFEGETTSGAELASEEKPTVVEPAVPFGIFSSTTNVEGEGNGLPQRTRCDNETEKAPVEPFTQAGGHPFCAFSEFVLNFAEDFAPSTLGSAVPVSVPKEAQFELPPGLLGNPLSTEQCPLGTFIASTCPPGSAVGYIKALTESGTQMSFLEGKETFPQSAQFFPSGLDNELNSSLIYNLKPSPGHPAEFGFTILKTPVLIEAKVRSDGDYGATVGDSALPRLVERAAVGAKATLCGFGVTYARTSQNGVEKREYICLPPTPGQKPFLTNPTKCTGEAPLTTLRTSSWAESGQAANGELPAVPFATMGSYAGAPSASPSFVGQPGTNATPVSSSFVTGCEKLSFEPQLSLQPTSTQADSPTGLTVHLNVPHTNEPARWGTNEKGKPGVVAPKSPPALKNSVVSLPEGMTVSPAGADGLTDCTNEQFGYGPGQEFGPGSRHSEPAQPARCPAASQIGTVKVTTPFLAQPLEGQVFVGQPECSPCLEAPNFDAASGRIFRLFLQVEDPAAGVIVKLVGDTKANEATGRLETTFENQPQTPFESLELKLKDGATASLQTPQSCGPTSLYADFTPWSTPGSPDTVFDEPSFTVTGCATPQPFAASQPFEAGTQNPQAAAYSPLTVNLSREDGEQNLASVKVQMPPGLTAKIAGQEECPEAQANAGSCPPNTQIGTATAGAGPGPHPFFERGPVYFTGPYKGAPFGLSIVIPAVAGPFNLGQIVVRQAIAVDKDTTAATVTSDPMPQIHDGVPLRLKKINVTLKDGFTLNPTNCSQQAIAATLTSTVGGVATPAFPYSARGCQNLAFRPTLTASTEAKTSKALGASFIVKVSAKPGEANIRKTELQIPAILPARLTTLQKACVDAVFNQDPANCPEGSVIGQATARTPLLPVPVTGPAILVSHGGAAFPDVIFVLQGDGIRLDLDGGSDIKGQITYSKFESVPDQPVESFETVLPRGPHSIFTANGNLCTAKIQIPTTITGQNGAVIKQMTKVAVTGCPKPLTRAQKLAAALKACKKKPKRQQKACARAARRAYASAARKAKRASKATARPASDSPSSQGSSGASPQLASPGALPAVSGAVAAGTARPALAPDPGPCPNESLRQESNIDPETGVPYSAQLAQLPECRAYEMVSPPEKQAHDAHLPDPEHGGLPVSPSGETAEFLSEGAFAEPQNFAIDGFRPVNPFFSSRTPTGWTTKSAHAPANLVEKPSQANNQGDFSPEFAPDNPAYPHSAQLSCGEDGNGYSMSCARREGTGAWVGTPFYTEKFNGGLSKGVLHFSYRGASSDLSRVFVQPGGSLLPSDTFGNEELNGAIYEIAFLGGASPKLRLVNFDNREVGGVVAEEKGELKQEPGSPFVGTVGAGPLLGDFRGAGEVDGTAYHAISANGEKVFFTATPTASQQAPGDETERQTVYARVRHGEGATETAETVPVSNPSPSECTEKSSEKCAEVKPTNQEIAEERVVPQAATFEGASADGSKVFFTTRQRLLNSDSGETKELYEYDFQNPGQAGGHLPAGAVGAHVVQLSAGAASGGACEKEEVNGKLEETTCGRGAEVLGVVRTSSDGSHVYFVATGVLTLRENNLGEKAKAGVANLYGVDTRTGEVKFVAELSLSDQSLWGAGLNSGRERCDGSSTPVPETKARVACDSPAVGAGGRMSQTTPDGRYLVFGTRAHPIRAGENPALPAQAIYRYDFEAGHGQEDPIWVSRGPYASSEAKDAHIPRLAGGLDGAAASIDNQGRAISTDGQYLMFTTGEKLSPQDKNTGNEVYLWHAGEVSLISPGQKGDEVDEGPGGQELSGGMSASGSDVFFSTRERLVGQDKDEQLDIYDARINGGFPAPPAPPPCFPESCQPGSALPTFGSPASMVFFPGGNVSSVTNLTPEAPSITIAAATLKGNTLMVSVKTSEPGTVTVSGAGLRSATKTLVAGVNRLSLPLTSAGKRTKRRHGTTKLKVTLKVGASAASTTRTVRL